MYYCTMGLPKRRQEDLINNSNAYIDWNNYTIITSCQSTYISCSSQAQEMMLKCCRNTTAQPVINLWLPPYLDDIEPVTSDVEIFNLFAIIVSDLEVGGSSAFRSLPIVSSLPVSKIGSFSKRASSSRKGRGDTIANFSGASLELCVLPSKS